MRAVGRSSAGPARNGRALLSVGTSTSVPAAKKTPPRRATARKTTPKARSPKTVKPQEPEDRDPPKAKALPPAKRSRIAVPQADKPLPHLAATDRPGVYLNSNGAFVDSNGVLLSLAALGDAEAALDEAILGKKVETPAELMKRIALDPRLPLTMRLDAAKGAAPYYDKKTPIATENTNVDKTMDLAVLAKLPKGQRAELLALLKGLGVDLGAL